MSTQCRREHLIYTAYHRCLVQCYKHWDWSILRERWNIRVPYFCPKNAGSWFVAFMNIPSTTTSVDWTMALDQKGGDSMRKFLMVARVALKTVSEIGRPSPSSRVRVAKNDHHGYNIIRTCQLPNTHIGRHSAYLSVPLNAAGVVCVNFKVRTSHDKPGCLALKTPSGTLYVFIK